MFDTSPQRSVPARLLGCGACCGMTQRRLLKSVGFSAALALDLASAYVEVHDENRRSPRTDYRLGDVNTIEVGRSDRPSQTLNPESVGLSLADGKQLYITCNRR
jgi:hypothetical protein